MQRNQNSAAHALPRSVVFSVRLCVEKTQDINTYRSSEAERQDQYLRENQSIHNSMRGAEDAISIAIAAKEALVSQR